MRVIILSSNSLPDVSLADVRVSETVMTAIFIGINFIVLFIGINNQ